MKKMIFICLIFAMLTSAAFAQTGVIREMTGEVDLRAAGAAAFSRANVGSQVAQDTIVSTGFRSTAVIEVGSTKITVRPLTRLSLREIQSAANEETLSVNLQTGRVRVEVKPAAGTRAVTSVQSPSATASVRGTVFDMDTQNLAVHEGKVMFMGNDGLSVPVTAGFSSMISAEGSSIIPILIAENELAPPAPVGTGSAGEEVAIPANVQSDNIDIIVGWD